MPNSSTAAEFIFGLLFVLACRWIKRNPSNFLRFALFPFGGISVERWPRFMLAMVRAAAILGFIAFLLTALNGLSPFGRDDLPSGSDYIKFGIAIVITFLALRGSAEPLPERVRSVRQPHALAPRPAASGSAPAAGGAPEQPRLSDVEAPPVPNRGYPEMPPPDDVVAKRRAHARSSVVIGLVFGTLFFAVGGTGTAIFFVALFGTAAALQVYTKNASVAVCPFCEKVIERYKPSVLLKQPIRCPHCSEYSQFVSGLLIPVNPQGSFAVMAKPFYRSPAYENGVWPNGCVLCGAPPTRYDQAGDVHFQYRRLATPMAAFVIPHPAAGVTGIPYCSRHRDAVQVVAPKEMFTWPWNYLPGYAERMEEKRKAFLLWRSLPMMRRYLEANRQAQSAVSTGYRAPNLFQRIVTAPFRGAKPGSPHPSPTPSAANKPSH